MAAVIGKHNVGGLVLKEKKTTVIGLPPDTWGEHEMVLVPTTQSIRLVIAQMLGRQKAEVEEADRCKQSSHSDYDKGDGGCSS